MKQCCGTCKCHVPGEIPGEGEWICNNAESEYYALETEYGDTCDDWWGAVTNGIWVREGISKRPERNEAD